MITLTGKLLLGKYSQLTEGQPEGTSQGITPHIYKVGGICNVQPLQSTLLHVLHVRQM